MKKALVLALAVVMGLSLMAMAGPYFVLENDGTLLAPTFTGGVDYSFAIQTEARVFLDTHWDAPASDWTSSVGVGLYGFRVDAKTAIDFNRLVNKLEGWDTSLTMKGNIFPGLQGCLGLSFNFDPTPPLGEPEWTLVPVFSIEGRW